jgi:hypothetical protein
VEEKLVHLKLKNGFVILTRKNQDDGSFLHFHAEINTRHTADLLWEQLLLGFSDSEKSWIWPLEYERSGEAPVGGLYEGCTSKMIYKVPRFDRPEIPAKAVTYTYLWRQFDPDLRLLEYRTQDHPLEGGAVVQVLPLNRNRSQLCWDGAYKYNPAQEIVIESIVNYFPLLYRTIEDLIEAGPERLDYTKE